MDVMREGVVAVPPDDVLSARNKYAQISYLQGVLLFMGKISPIPFKQTKRAPRVGDSYYFINSNFRVAKRVWLNHEDDVKRLKRDNIFSDGQLKVAKQIRNRMLDLLHT